MTEGGIGVAIMAGMAVMEVMGIQSTLPVLVLFLILKTASDVAAHIDKHQLKKYSDGTAGVS